MFRALLSLTILAALFAMVLGLTNPNFHNHEADFHDHENCVVYILTSMLAFILISAAQLILALHVVHRLERISHSHYQFIPQYVSSPRAPPVNSHYF